MNEPSKITLPQEITDLLNRLRGKIRRYILLEGVARLLAVVGLIFWASFLVDWTYFQLSHFELPVWFRASIVLISVTAIFVLAVSLLLFRLMKKMRRKALALVLERRFPELNDRLATAIELHETHEPQNALTRAMLERTVNEVAEGSRQLPLEEVFDKRPLRRAFFCALALCVSILTLALFNQPAMARWAKGYLELRSDYWNRETGLVVKVIAQPGDRVKDFQDQVYKHGLGNDLTLLVETVDGKKAPERVQLTYRMQSGRGGGRTVMSRMGEGRFKHTITDLLEDIQIWVSGNDYTNPEPYTVKIVETPVLDQIQLDCIYPEYMGLNLIEASTGKPVPDQMAVQGTQISIPVNTQFDLISTANKPITRYLFETDRLKLQLEPPQEDRETESYLAWKNPQGEIISQTEITGPDLTKMCDAERHQFRIPFTLVAESKPKSDAQSGSLPAHIPLVADEPIRIYLEDADGLLVTEPIRLSVNGIVDQPPKIDTRLKGIGKSITRKAMIPVQGIITDDYGIQSARFDFLVDEDKSFRPRPFRSKPSERPREFTLQRNDKEEWERFEVLPLDLKVGQKISLTVHAEDADNLSGPHQVHGETYHFEIVTDEELLSQLYSKELNLRKRFEQIFKEVAQTRDELAERIEQLKQAETIKAKQKQGQTDPKWNDMLLEIRTAVAVSADRSLYGTRKNATETASIVESFYDIREELVNNGVATSQILGRIDDKILKPLTMIQDEDFPGVDQHLGLFRLAIEKNNDPLPEMQTSIELLNAMLTRMQSVLDEMQDLLEFHEAIEMLKNLIEREKELTEETKKYRKNKLLDRLKGLGLE
jgi:DNA-binding ferritin-like protein